MAYSHITLLVDNSGSMAQILSDIQPTLDAYLADQEAVEGRCTVSVWAFSYRTMNVHSFVPIDGIRPKIKPSGMTVLYDAVIEALDADSKVINLAPKAWQPDHKLLVVISDGQDTASRNNPVRYRARIAAAKEDGWQVQFIGCDENANREAAQVGFHVSNYTAGDAAEGFLAASATTRSFRGV